MSRNSDVEEVAPENRTCSLCRRVFTRPSNVRRHVENVHLKIKRFKCGICMRAYTKKESLQYHLRTKHGIEEKGRSSSSGGGRRRASENEHLIILSSLRKSSVAARSTTSDLGSYSSAQSRDNSKPNDTSDSQRDDATTLPKFEISAARNVAWSLTTPTVWDPNKCNFCGTLFITQEQLRDHCDSAHARSPATSDQARKRLRRHSFGEFRCTARACNCQQVFSDVEELNKHILSFIK